jgi:small subunit ribosomal protein S7
MSRRHSAEKREILPDPKFGDMVVSKFINNVMLAGKKSVSERIVYDALEIVRVKQKLANDNDVLKYFHEALDNVKPQLEVKSKRVGGATYQVPMEVSALRQMALAMRWIRDFARKRGKGEMKDKLAAEIMDAHDNKGGAKKKQDDTHKMADANKAFAHFRFN